MAGIWIFVLFCLLIRNKLMKQICHDFFPFGIYLVDSQFFGRFALANSLFKGICVNNSTIISLKLGWQNIILRTCTDPVCLFFFNVAKPLSWKKRKAKVISTVYLKNFVLSPRLYYRFYGVSTIVYTKQWWYKNLGWQE